MINAGPDSKDNDLSVIVPAAGLSERMGGEVRKPFLTLGGEEILLRTCRKLAKLRRLLEIIVVVHPDDVAYLQDERWEELHEAGVELVVAGGESRAESVWNGLEVVGAKAEMVAVHDAVRPFFAVDLAEALVETARRVGAAIPVRPLADTVKRVAGDRVEETVRRTGLMRVGTPQVFRSDVLIEAYEYGRRTGGLSGRITDDAQLVEEMGGEVGAVLDSEYNIKITSPADLRLAEALLAAGLAE